MSDFRIEIGTPPPCPRVPVSLCLCVSAWTPPGSLVPKLVPKAPGKQLDALPRESLVFAWVRDMGTWRHGNMGAGNREYSTFGPLRARRKLNRLPAVRKIGWFTERTTSRFTTFSSFHWHETENGRFNYHPLGCETPRHV